MKISKQKKLSHSLGFSLMELLVAIFIFSIIISGMVMVFVSVTGAQSKSRAIKEVVENAQFALNYIAKDIRMAKVEEIAYSDGTERTYLMVTRNNKEKICYQINRSVASSYLAVCRNAGVNCSAAQCPTYEKIVDLSGSGMRFSNNSYFISCPTSTVDSTDPSYYACPAGSTDARRGWVKIFLEIVPQSSGQEMTTEPIQVEAFVSSRDYGWEEKP